MVRALATLLDGAIDYAGLYPPAKLDMEAAVANYLSYRQGAPKSLLGRFVCPAGHLRELAMELANDPDIAPIGVSVIGQASHDRHSWETAREHDAKAMNEFLGGAEGLAEIEAYELQLPETAGIERYLQELEGFAGVDLFVELPWCDYIADRIALLAESEVAGAKARTGGIEAAAFPTAEQLATFIYSSVSLDWQFKLTAGLHHAFPTEDRTLGVRHHGLVSVFAGTALVLAEDLSRRELQTVLEADSTAWRFGPETIACLEFEANLDDIAAARDLFVSVGSCSVEEPLQELESLGLVRG